MFLSYLGVNPQGSRERQQLFALRKFVNILKRSKYGCLDTLLEDFI
jgi:hypothetical protein